MWWDAFLSAVALAGFALFLGILAWFVREPDLIIILAFGVLCAAYDFWRSFRYSRQNGN
jgi:hypothetical protein